MKSGHYSIEASIEVNNKDIVASPITLKRIIKDSLKLLYVYNRTYSFSLNDKVNTILRYYLLHIVIIGMLKKLLLFYEHLIQHSLERMF